MHDGSTAVFAGPVEQFVGVYSGRISDESDLGFVWKATAVRDIVDEGARGTVYVQAELPEAEPGRGHGLLGRGSPTVCRRSN
jgi:hypothetical protein